MLTEGFDPKLCYKLLLIDLDRFKVVNDTYGHQVGDRLLIQVAERVRANAGSDGFVARLGGDEMAVLVYGDLDQAMSVAQGIVGAISETAEQARLLRALGCDAIQGFLVGRPDRAVSRPEASWDGRAWVSQVAV